MRDKRTIELISKYIDEITPFYGTNDKGDIMLYDSNHKCIVNYSNETKTIYGDNEGLMNKVYTIFGHSSYEDSKEALKVVMKKNFPDIFIRESGFANIVER